ncbi:MAG: hypothetical protein ACLQVK_11740 [Acidimicrobiales bacterium]
MNHDEVLLQRVTVSVEIDYEAGSQHIAAAMCLDVMSRLAHDGVEPRWATLEITGPATTP